MNELLRDGVLVGIGGFFGAAGRFLLSGWIGARVVQFPAGTLTVNVIGSLAVGLLAGAAAGRLLDSGAARLLVMAGFLGAFTTFSAFSMDVLNLAAHGRIALAALYAGATVVLCIAAVFAGHRLAGIWS